MERDLDALEARTMAFAVAVYDLCRVGSRQLHLRSPFFQVGDAAGSVASNHRAMRRARSTREFAAKLKIVHEEADEAVHWLELIRQSNRDADVASRLDGLIAEGSRLRNLFGRARATTRRRFPPRQ
ncbi:MAG: four helix bundle protein [Acidobacteria bacterium]|nr:four helix bundle protein [Acidobacteriota bacterium]